MWRWSSDVGVAGTEGEREKDRTGVNEAAFNPALLGFGSVTAPGKPRSEERGGEAQKSQQRRRDPLVVVLEGEKGTGTTGRGHGHGTDDTAEVAPDVFFFPGLRSL